MLPFVIAAVSLFRVEIVPVVLLSVPTVPFVMFAVSLVRLLILPVPSTLKLPN